MPNMTVLCPSAISEMEQMLRYAVFELSGPVTIRYPRGGHDSYISDGPPYEPMSLRNGSDVAIISYGRLVENAMGAAELLDKQGISATVIKLTEISCISPQKLFSLLGDVGTVFVVEECVSGGCLASKLALEFSAAGFMGNIIPINLGIAVMPSASVEELMRMYSLDAAGIADIIVKGL